MQDYTEFSFSDSLCKRLGCNLSCLTHENFEAVLQNYLNRIIATDNCPNDLKYLDKKYNFIYEEMMMKDWEHTVELKGVEEKLLKQATWIALITFLKHVGLLESVAKNEM